MAAMSFLQTIESQIKAATLARDTVRLGTLRLLKAALVNKAVEKARELDEAESLQVASALVKQRRDAIEMFEQGGRRDLADRDRAEIAVLEGFLPPPASAADIQRAVEEAVAATGASSQKDIGKVMKAAMASLAGSGVDGKVVNEAVRRRLSGN
jgi:uncharacterized protein